MTRPTPLIFLAVLASCLLSVTAHAAEKVVVEILDAPPGVFRYEPFYVTFEVRNEGREPLLIPADECPHEGAFLEVGEVGAELSDTYLGSGCTTYRLVRLPPGGRWLFYHHVELPEGTYELEAVLKNHGECGGQPVGPGRQEVEPSRVLDRGRALYDCWQGEERSQRIEIGVEVPTSPADLAAAEALRFEPNTWKYRLILGYPELVKRFPTSHYTYAAFQAAGGGVGMVDVVLLQPENPLNPWVAAAIAEDLAKKQHPCVISPPPPTPPDLEERYTKVIAAYPPPKPVAEYLEQQRREYAAETCDERPGSTGTTPPSPPGAEDG